MHFLLYIISISGTLLQQRKKLVRVNKEETLLILRAYMNHPTSWSEILEEMRANLTVMSPEARQLYESGALKQLRDRMSGKMSALMKKRLEDIVDVDIR